jgi:glycosyltransferase involved in cell wall biosynthesis
MTETEPMLPLVSVIIPTRNRAALLDRALDSVLAQEGLGKLFELDVIVVDDGSTDSTIDVVRRYPQVRHMVSHHRGVAGTRNIGIQASRGRFVCFLDDDDVWLPKRLKLQIPALERHTEAGAVYSQVFHTETGKAYPELSHAASGRIFNALLFGNCMCVHSVLIRREAFEKAGYFDESLSSYEDWDLWLRLSFHFPFVFVPGLVAVYIVSGFGLWQSDANAEQNNARVVDKALRMLPDAVEYAEMKTTARVRVALAYCPTWTKVLETLRAYPWVVRHAWARRWVSRWIRTRAVKNESPLSAVQRLCGEMKASARPRGIMGRWWVRQTVAKAWADTASALASGPPAQRRDAGRAAVRAVALSPSLLIRGRLAPIIASGVFVPGSAVKPAKVKTQ